MESSEVGAYWEGNAPAWIELSRAGYDIYRDALNTPAFLDMLPDVDRLTGLDLGCGEGTNTRQLALRGARMTGVDIAPTFIKAARASETADPLGVAFQIEDATELSFPADQFDFVTAFMSLMDMPDQSKALAEAHRVLTPEGFFQFSILHPCFIPPTRKTLRDADGMAYAVELSDYFRRTEGEVETWHFSAALGKTLDGHPPFKVPRFHRTLADWIAMIGNAGFFLEALEEPMADEETVRQYPKLSSTRVTPIFLHLRLRKRGAAPPPLR